MNILYDLTFQAAWHGQAAGRTGVFRVAEEVQRGLAATEGCRVRYAVSENVAGADAYLRAGEPAAADALAHSPWQRSLSGTVAPVRAAISRTLADRRFSRRAARRLGASVVGGVDRLTVGLPEAVLDWADVYHSPVSTVHPQVARRAGRRPVTFVTVYDLIAVLFPEFYEPAQAAIIRRNLDGVSTRWALAISECTRRDLIAHCGCDPARVFVTPLAAGEHFRPCGDPEAIGRVRTACKIPPGDYVLSLCTLEPRKNLAFVIRAFGRLVREEKLADLSLVLVGNLGWKTAGIFEALADEPGLRERVIITGFVADADLACLYSGALAFVYLSLYEGFGLPPLEAMQCGVPVITSNNSSLPEVVGDAGQTVDPRDEDGFCAALLNLLRDPAQRASWARKSLDRAAQYSWQRTVGRTVEAYRTALAAGG